MANYFEVVHEGGILPTRATKGSAGYDLYVSEDTIIPPYPNFINTHMPDEGVPFSLSKMEHVTKATCRPVLVPTGIACHLDEGYYLQILSRSSTPLKYWLVVANSVGIIDSDYYPNPIYVQLINLSPYPIKLKAGDKIAQAIISKYEVTDDEITPDKERTSGFGSTGTGI